ncbi:hypothetical protein COY95_03730, partial [Candidatus Woesearchaeota archaeon CG_4_10_14_0_8_um_filter_47_5]
AAERIAGEKGLKITYEVGDAAALMFGDNSFDGVLFSNQGWCQIPGRENRLRALSEMRRVAVPGGIVIFSAHIRRLFDSRYGRFWIKEWLRWHVFWWYVLRKHEGKIPEGLEYGDIFFSRDAETEYARRQFIHIAGMHEVREIIASAGLRIIACHARWAIAPEEREIGENSVFFVCRK